MDFLALIPVALSEVVTHERFKQPLDSIHDAWRRWNGRSIIHDSWHRGTLITLNNDNYDTYIDNFSLVGFFLESRGIDFWDYLCG